MHMNKEVIISNCIKFKKNKSKSSKIRLSIKSDEKSIIMLKIPPPQNAGNKRVFWKIKLLHSITLQTYVYAAEYRID